MPGTSPVGDHCAHLHLDRCTRTGQQLWWVDLTDDDGVGEQRQFKYDEREQAIQFCAEWVQDGLILEFSNGELDRTIEVEGGKACHM